MKKTPVLNDPNVQDGSSGSYGTYTKISNKVGLKIIDRSCHSDEDLADDYKSFLNHITEYDHISVKDIGFLDEAARELVAMQMLRGTGCTPKPKGLCWIRNRKKRLQIGILMEHIEGDELANVSNNSDAECDRMEDRCKVAWRNRFGISVYDWHDSNIMVEKKTGRRVRIDFSPDYFGVSDSRFKEFSDRVIIEVLNLMENCPIGA